MGGAVEAWLEREEELIEQHLETARVYRFASPFPDSDYMAEFFSLMENTVDERDFVIQDWKYRNGELELDDDPLGLEDRETADDISDLFCDECTHLSWVVGVIGDKHICSDCWDENDWENQDQLTGYETPERTDYVLVGCGKDKKDRRHQAKDLYKSGYFEKKQDFAEELGDSWKIISAEHGLLEPEKEIEYYDTTIEDVDTKEWLSQISEQLDQVYGGISEFDRVWVLVGKRYLDNKDSTGRTLRNLLDSKDWTTVYPFNQTSGIGKQNRYLKQAVEQDEIAMPYKILDEKEGQLTFNDF
ncbi:hypothetical protein OB919_15955 [Halobacteria archaeon AArc-curdl1]|uniref:DUF6884 domain-containing protein n=1 Tax=Natronosalvus hydrolyticus TaxID=2979988 RepID=A0AAP3E8P3_9EURY|nr:hypothetical protein [Halobacteria archaeon AArc-curdl1]